MITFSRIFFLIPPLLVLIVSFRIETTVAFTIPPHQKQQCCHPSLSLHAMQSRYLAAFGNPPKTAGLPNKHAATATTTTLAGKLVPFLSKFALTKSKLQDISKAFNTAIDLREFLFITFIGWGLLPFVQYILVQFEKQQQDTSHDDATLTTLTQKKSSLLLRDKTTFTYKVMDSISKLGKIGTVVYSIDIVSIFLHSLGFPALQQMQISSKVGKLAILYWIMIKIKQYKLGFWKRTFGSTYRENSIGRADTFNRLSNIVLYFLFLLLCLEQLQLNNFGIALQSIFAFGGVGTLIFSLASKDIATQLVSGLALSASAPFFVGDDVEFGNGIKGKIVKIGWLSTWIRGSDELITKVPNQQIANQRQANVSRIKLCQVTQKLRFGYEHIDDIPSLVEDMKHEIEHVCPTLITDGSRPFRINWRNFEEDHLEVVVDCHFEQPPSGDAYYSNRQEVLEAIARTVKRKGMKFAIPTSISQNIDINSRNDDNDDVEGQKIEG